MNGVIIIIIIKVAFIYFMQTSNQIPSQLSLLLPKSSNIKIADSITGQRSLLGNNERDIIETDTEKMYYGVQNNYKWGVLLKSHGDSRFIDDLDDEVDWAQIMQESDFCIKLDEILCDLSHRENYFNSGANIRTLISKMIQLKTVHHPL